MTVTLSLFAGAGQQFFDNNGTPLSGGKIETYFAGTTTPLATYTSVSGTIAHTNPIILDAAGRVSGGGEIWLTTGIGYKFVVKTSADILIATLDNIPSSAQPPAANDADSIMYEQGYSATAGNFIVGLMYRIVSVGTTNFTLIGAASNTPGLHFIATGVGTGNGVAEVSQTVETKLRETVSVKDFGAIGNGVANDTVAIQAAVNTGKLVSLIDGETYLVENISATDVRLIGGGTVKLKNGQNTSVFSVTRHIELYGVTIDGNWVNQTYQGNTTEQYGVRRFSLSNADSILNIIGCTFKNCIGGGIYVYRPESTATIQNIENNLIYDCGLFGIQLDVSPINVNVSNNRIFNIGLNSSGSSFGDQLGDGIYLERAKNCTVTNNRVSNCWRLGITLEELSGLSDKNVIANNVVEQDSATKVGSSSAACIWVECNENLTTKDGVVISGNSVIAGQKDGGSVLGIVGFALKNATIIGNQIQGLAANTAGVSVTISQTDNAVSIVGNSFAMNGGLGINIQTKIGVGQTVVSAISISGNSFYKSDVAVNANTETGRTLKGISVVGNTGQFLYSPVSKIGVQFGSNITDAVISNNVFQNSDYIFIKESGVTDNTSITDNVGGEIYIHAGLSNNLTVSGNICTKIDLYNTPNGTYFTNLIVNNNDVEGTEFGIDVQYAQKFNIQNNHLKNCGARLLTGATGSISGNTITSEDANNYGTLVYGGASSVSSVLISSNHIFDTQAVPTLPYGITCSQTVMSKTVVRDNLIEAVNGSIEKLNGATPIERSNDFV